MTDCEALIVGAGPTGLVLALWLTKLGVRVRIIDKTSGPGTTSRALAVQARTLELYRQLGLAEAVVDKAHKVPAGRAANEELGSPSTKPGPASRPIPPCESSRRTNTSAC